MEDQNRIIDVENLPYGDWFRSSPMKISQRVVEKTGVYRNEIHKTLFSKPPHKISVEPDEPKGSIESTEHQVSELMSNLQKVEVSERK